MGLCLWGLRPQSYCGVCVLKVIVGFASSKLLPAQKDYHTTDLEALGLTFGITKFEKYLSVANKPFEVKTDHKPLLSIWEEIPEKESVRYR
eukprot:Awhi_evm1s10644